MSYNLVKSFRKKRQQISFSEEPVLHAEGGFALIPNPGKAKYKVGVSAGTLSRARWAIPEIEKSALNYWGRLYPRQGEF